MTIIDPIADLFTRIRNGLGVNHNSVIVTYSQVKVSILKILKEEGFITFYEIENTDLNKKVIKVGLKYTSSGASIIKKIVRKSKPSKRVYVQKHEIPKVLNGFGICILSTSSGVLSGRSARLKNVGGELLGLVY